MAKFSSQERLLVVCFCLLALISPLYVNRGEDQELEEDAEPFSFLSLLPLFLILLTFAIAFSLYLDTNFDHYWIYRFGGSSGGIFTILLLLALILKCRESLLN
ncbi:hypothetical protein LINPERHAP2_LOCUS392 [Linum perenne]